MNAPQFAIDGVAYRYRVPGQGARRVEGEASAWQVPAGSTIWWDGDLLREPLDGTRIDKWDYLNSKADRLLSAHDHGVAANNGTKANPALSADILGDWREEVIYRTTDNNELRIFTMTIPTEHRFYTLMHDPIYRLSIAWQNVGYNQPPHTGFYIGPGMTQAPRPNITMVAANREQSSTQAATQPAAAAQLVAATKRPGGISGPGKPWTGDVSRLITSRATGSAVQKGLLPPIKPILDLHIRDTVICVGGGQEQSYDTEESHGRSQGALSRIA